MYRILIKKSCSNLKPKSNVLNWQQINGIKSSPIVVSQAGFGKYIVILAPFITVGGVAAYAKHDEDFRKFIIKNIPLSEKPLKVILGEDNPLDSVTKTFDGVSKSVTGLFGNSKPEDVGLPVKKVEKYVPPPTSSAPIKSPPSKSNDIPIPMPSPTSPPSPPKDVPKAAKPIAPALTPPKQTTKSTTPAAGGVITSLLPSELERSVEDTAAIAIDGYRKAIDVLKSYNEEVKRVVEQSIEKHDNSVWTALAHKSSSKDALIKIAENTANEARIKIKQIENNLSKNHNLDDESVNNLKTTIRNVSDNLDLANIEFYKMKENIAESSDKFWRRVEAARNYFDNQLQSLFPNLNLVEKRLNLSKTELDLYLLHAYSHVMSYQAKLQKLENQEESKSRKEIEKELEVHMKRQTAAHLEHLKEVIELKENEMKRNFVREFDEKISIEQNAYKLQLSAMLGKLKGMNDALKELAGAGKSAQQAQDLGSACISLWNSVKYGDPTVSWDKRIRPLANEIKAINDSAIEGDRLILTVLKTIPEEVQKRGVYPEDALRERFFKVSTLARRLALVPENGAPLPVYILSYLQSIFILNQSNPISKEEISDQKIDFNKLDTYDILNRAKYWLDHGNIAQSLKYMNLLNGAPRKVAKDWINEARIFLETQQAVTTLLAYVKSGGR